MRWRLRLITCGLAVLLSGGALAAGDAAAGAEKSVTCASCHGAGGDKPIANYPKLAGQSRKYLLQVLREYKSGARSNPVMGGQLAELNDADLQDLAAYYSAQSGSLR